MKWIRFAVYGNLVVSASAGALAGAGAFRNTNPHYIGLGLTVFFATLFVYNIQRLLRIEELHVDDSEHLSWIKKHKTTIKMLMFVGLAGATATYFLVLRPGRDFLMLTLAGAVCIVYALQLKSGFKGLRDIPYLKIYLIAGFWTFLTIYWPYLRFPQLRVLPWQLGIAVFFYILAATVPFDVRDLPYDSHRKRTIPQLFGVNGAKLAALFFLAASAGALYFAIPNLFHSVLFYAVYPGLMMLILGSRPARHELYFSGLIDFWITSFALLIFVG